MVADIGKYGPKVEAPGTPREKHDERRQLARSYSPIAYRICRNCASLSRRPINIRYGLSLVEVIVSTLLVGTIVIGSLSMLGASVRSHSYSSDLATGPMLAESMLTEVMSMPYYDVDGVSGATTAENDLTGPGRTGFDDIDDYDNWAPTDVQDRQGNVLSQYAGWTRTVDTNWALQSSGNSWFADTGLMRITVTVTSPDGKVTTRRGYRSRDGALEQAPTLDKMVVSQIEATLSVGTAASLSTGAINLLNHVEVPSP